MKRHLSSLGRAGIALSLALLVLVLNAMAACPALHELVHHDADTPGHDCVVTMFAHGQVDSAAVEVSVPIPSTVVATAPQFAIFVFAPVVENLPPGRAPPLFSAVS